MRIHSASARRFASPVHVAGAGVLVAAASVVVLACGSSPSSSPSESLDAGGLENDASAAHSDGATTDGASERADAEAGADGAGEPTGRTEDQQTIALGGHQACALLADASVKCWGGNPYGGLGVGDTKNRGDLPGEMGAALPAVDLVRPAVAIAAGGDHTCAILDTGAVKCWGSNQYGQLGLGDTENRGDAPGEMGAALPTVDLGPGRVALGITAGSQFTCARLDDGSVRCWGRNHFGELGLGDKVQRGSGPAQMGSALPAVDLGPGRKARALAANAATVCVRLDDGAVKCWGAGQRGILGSGNENDRGGSPGQMGAALPPVDLGPGRSALQIAVGGGHACAILDDGNVKCWGWNESGQLGLDDTVSRGDVPGKMGAALPAVDLGPKRTARAIATGGFHTCARLDDGTLKCWGDGGFGELGLGDPTNRGMGPGKGMGALLPTVDVGPGRTVIALTASFSTCAVLDDANVKCWGYNAYGQLGLGDTNHRGDGPGQMGASLPPVELK